jgi:glycosyltransferase involved in cell wall biosynthesis
VGEAYPRLPGLLGRLPGFAGETRRDLYQGIRLALLARERGLTHLHAHFATSATSVARIAALLAGIPYSFTAHAKDIYHESVEQDDLRRKLVGAHTTTTVSEFNLTWLRARHGAAAARVQRIYNGLDLEEFAFSSPRARPPRVVFVGRLVQKKGVEVLLEACAQLAGRGVAFQCDVIGTGPLEPALRSLAARQGLAGRVRFLGAQPRLAVIGHLRGAAALAAPCVVSADGDRDGLPTVLLEAMALGTPCVATAVTGIPEAVRDEDTGLLVPERDAGALASAIARLLAGRSLRVRLAEAARRLVAEEFDVHRNAARLRESFTAACAAAQEVA